MHEIIRRQPSPGCHTIIVDMDAKPKGTAVFVFPSAAGHVSPSLPLCTRLVIDGWKVDYVAVDQFKDAIEGTGATYHSRNEIGRAHGGYEDLQAILVKSAFEDYADAGARQWGLNFGSATTARLVPMFLAWLGARPVRPSVIVYCPVLCPAAHFAGLKLNIPTISLLTAAGPGYMDAAFDRHCGGHTAAQAAARGLMQTVSANAANAAAIARLRTLLDRPDLELNTVPGHPTCHEYYSEVNLVSTVRAMADGMWEENAQFYEERGVAFEYVGPLQPEGEEAASATVAAGLSAAQTANLFARVDQAINEGRRICYVSLGTVLTSTAASAEHGWLGTSGTALTGKAMCQAVYRAVFRELGGADSSDGGKPLLIISVGPEADAVSTAEVGEVPANAVCVPAVPQVQLLHKAAAGLALVLTHGGQNTFMEALAVGAPLVVCPGFGDQIANGARAKDMGVGVVVPRPLVKADKEGMQGQAGPSDALTGARAAEHDAAVPPEVNYEEAVAAGVREVFGAGHFAERAVAVAVGLKQAGGTKRAAELVAQVVQRAGGAGTSKTNEKQH